MFSCFKEISVRDKTKTVYYMNSAKLVGLKLIRLRREHVDTAFIRVCKIRMPFVILSPSRNAWTDGRSNTHD